MKKGIIVWILGTLVLLLLPNSFAAGGGGGGSSSSGLGFGSRDSVYILVNQDYSQKFSLKNGTKYDLKMAVDNNVTVTFGSLFFQLQEGDNFVDLDDNGLADINFNLIDIINGKRANIRIINEKDVKNMPETSKKVPEKPAEEKKQDVSEDESGLRCGNLETLKERVSCRLDLEEEEQEEELELYYLPEECRALSGSDRGICIARYKSVQTCWKFPIGKERVSCVKMSMNLGVIQEEKDECNKLGGEERLACVRELKNKVYNLVKWHFYDLEERAEDFVQRGLIDRTAAVDFISKTEQNKARFNEAKTHEERKNIVLGVRDDWKEFVAVIKENLRG